MTPALSKIARSAASNAAFLAVAAGAFIGFTIFYTRNFGVAQYGEFSFLLNTVTALIALGAYEGFLITHSVTQTRRQFDRFNARFWPFNAGLVLVATAVFVATTGIIDWRVIASVLIAMLLDYRSQSCIAVLMTCDDNWKIRAFRTAYQVILVGAFSGLRFAEVEPAQAFAFAILAAATINFGLLLQSAAAALARGDPGRPLRQEAGAGVLSIAVATNVATVLFLLIDKIAIRWLDIGSEYQVGLYFLFFDLAVRAEALYLLLAVPVTNHLFNNAQNGTLVSREVIWMIAGCAALGAIAGILGHWLVPPVYDVSLERAEALPWIFGLYVAARGVRYLLKAVCNATGRHWTLLASNYAVLAAGLVGLGGMQVLNAGVISVIWLAALLSLAQVCRVPFLIAILVRGHGWREHMVTEKC